MPTTRARHMITETDVVSAMLDDAARRWPDDADSRAQLIVRLMTAGHHTLLDDSERTRAARTQALRATEGALTGVYGPDYLAELRADWPS